MARILLVWELGANLGHLASLRAVATILSQRGHEIHVALRDLAYAREVLGELPSSYLQAPYYSGGTQRRARDCLSFTHIMSDCCAPDKAQLAALVTAWQHIFSAVKPDLVFYDHSPSALIASSGMTFAKIIIGNGFFTPPTQPVLGAFAPFLVTPRKPEIFERLRRDDLQLLQRVNAVCEQLGVPVFPSLAAIYAQADVTLRTTFRELDHFGEREDAAYLGIQPSFGAAQPTWPENAGDATRVFCYVQNFKSLPALLAALRDNGLAALVYGRDLPAQLVQHFSARGMVFTDKPVCLEAVSEQADFVVSHAGHGAAAQFFLGGVPQFCLPKHQEQMFLTLRMRKAGSAVGAYCDQPGYRKEIDMLLSDGRYRRTALAHKRRYADFSWENSAATIERHVVQLLS